VSASGDKTRAVPLNIARALDERGVGGDLTIKVEGLPLGSGLSAGRNNWDGTWSLTVAELQDLKFLPPEDSDADRTLSVRALRYDKDGFNVASTVALIDIAVEVPKKGAAKTKKKAATPETGDADWREEAKRMVAEAKAAWDKEA